MYNKLFNGKIAKVKQVLQLSNFFIFPHHPWEIFGSARMILCNNYCTSLFILNNIEKKTVFNNGLVISVASKKMLASSLPGRMIIVNTSNHISWFLISKQNKWRLCWFGQRITTLPPYHDWPHDKIYTIRSTTEPDKLMRHHQYTIITSITSHKYYYHSLITLVQFPTRTISNLSQKYIYICIVHWLPL